MLTSQRLDRQNPLVSVIVPNFNHRDFLPQRVQSISEQLYQYIEIILLDDCSNDDSQAILRQFKESDARVVHCEFNLENSGRPISQWIKGLQVARGKYVWIAESDDFSDSNFIHTLLGVMESDQRIGIGYCASVQVDASSAHVGHFELNSPLFEYNLWQKDFVLDGKYLVNGYFPIRNIIPNASAALFNRELLVKHIYKAADFSLVADWIVYIHIALESRIAFVNQPLNYCRVHSTSVTRSHSIASYRRMLRERLSIFRTLFEHANMTTHGASALKQMLENRHKFVRAERLYAKINNAHSPNKLYGLYGFNDIAKYIVDRTNTAHLPAFVIDKSKAGNQYNHIPITAIEDVDMDDVGVIAILSLRYAAEMEDELRKRGFDGEVLIV
ncbi:glycosyltransferase family 2 protein [uncultured Alteromonas sp.]|uniref:glycosyltransferase family 2 protein n=1 Tax=uncultured Alteromonas sp. TaxID=179113 RepID=UPI0030D76182